MAIIFLNGCTSAGKTSLAHTLQDRLSGAWLRVGIDDAIAALGARYHDHPDGFRFDQDERGLVRLHIGSVGEAALRAWRRGAAAMVASGASLIIDEVLLCPDWLADWRAVLPDVPLLLVGVRCNLAELERRERARGDRVIGQARGQFGLVHAAIAYDLEVDTGMSSLADCADAIVERIEAA